MRIRRLFLYGLMAIATDPSVAQQNAKYLDPIEDRIDDLLLRVAVNDSAPQGVE